MASPPRLGAPQAHAPRPVASTTATTTTTMQPWTDSPAQLTPTTDPPSPSSASTRSIPFSLGSTHLRPRHPAADPALDRPADLFAASIYAHQAQGEALFGPPPRSPLVAPPRRSPPRAHDAHEQDRARLRSKYALKPEQEEVLGRMMQGVWERLGGEPLRGDGSAQLRRAQGDGPRAPPAETPDLSSLTPSKAASPIQPALSLPNSPPSTRTSVYDVRGDAWAADERLDLRPLTGTRTPFASTTPLDSPPVVMTPVGSPRSTYRSRRPSPIPIRSTSVSPPPSPPPGAASPRPADRTLTPMPSPPVVPSSGASFPHLERERAPLFRALGWSYLPARSGLRTQRAPLVDGELGVEEREWAERTRRVPDDGGLRDFWGNPVGLGGGDWGRAVLSPIVTETEPTHSSPALSFRSGASFLSRSSIRRRDPLQQHRRTVSVPLEALDYADVGSERSAASRSARPERDGPRTRRSPLVNGIDAHLDDGGVAHDPRPTLDSHDELSSFAASIGRPPSEQFFGAASSMAPPSVLADPTRPSRRSRSTNAQHSFDSGRRAGDETTSHRSNGSSILPPGVEYDPSLTASDYAHAAPDLGSPPRDNSFFLGAAHEPQAPTAATRSSRRNRAASSAQQLSTIPSSGAESHRSRDASLPTASPHMPGEWWRAGSSSRVLAEEDDAAGRESSFGEPASSAMDGQPRRSLFSVEPSSSPTSGHAPPSSRRASRPSESSRRTDPHPLVGALDSPSLPPSSSSPQASSRVDDDHYLRSAASSSRRAPRSPTLDDRALAQPSLFDSPLHSPRDYSFDSPSSRSATYSTATGAAWASPPRSPPQQALPQRQRRWARDEAGGSRLSVEIEQTRSSTSGSAAESASGQARRRRDRLSTALADSSRKSSSRIDDPRSARPSSSASSNKGDISRWASGVAVGACGETSEPSQASSTERAGRSTDSSRTDLPTSSSRLAVDHVGQHASSPRSPSHASHDASHDSSSRSPPESSVPPSASRASRVVSPSSTPRTPSEYVSATEYLSTSDPPPSSSSRRRRHPEESASSWRSPPPASSPFYGASSRSHIGLDSSSACPSRSRPSSDVLSPESSLFGVGSPTSTPPQRRPLLSFAPRALEVADSPVGASSAAPVAVGRGPSWSSAAASSEPDPRVADPRLELGELTTTSSLNSPPLVATEIAPLRSPIKPVEATSFSGRSPPPSSPHVQDWDGQGSATSYGPSDEGLNGYADADADVVPPHGPLQPIESPCSSPSRSTYSASSMRAAVQPQRYVARPPVKPARRGPGPFPVPQLSEEEKLERRELRRTGRDAEWDLPVSETKSGRRKAAWDEMQAFEKERARLFKLLGDPLTARDVPVLNALAGLYLDSTNSAVRAQAIQLLQNSLQLDEMQPDTARLLALQLEDVDVEEALSWHRFAVEQGPESPERHLSLGHCLLRAGDPGEASHVFLTIARSFTDEPYEAIALYELGRLYQQHGAGGPAERTNAIEAFEGALACLTRLRLESPETRLGERWDELELVERAVLRGLQEVREGQRSASESPFASKHATPRGPLSPVVSTKARLPPRPQQPAAPHLAMPPSSAASPPAPPSSPPTSPRQHRQPVGIVDVDPPSRSPTQLNEAVPAAMPVRPPRRCRRKADPETARTLDTIMSSLSRLSRTSPAADLAHSTRALAEQVERTYVGLKNASGEEAAQQDELVMSLGEVQRALGALPDKLVSQAKLIAARPSGAPLPPPTAVEHDPLEKAMRKVERARAFVV
ncbi:hypothetical protein JCM8208_005358 [Rhodotorula glutinis]